mgnify:CR=1 FL=1
MEIEIIYGQVIAKANNYQAVPGKDGRETDHQKRPDQGV